MSIGKIGNFPSLVVEESDEYGEPMSNEWDETPPCSAPPVFTPPDVPNYLVPSEVIVTQATPTVELQDKESATSKPPPSDPPPAPKEVESKFSFSMKMTTDQHDQYGSQFSEGIPGEFFCYFSTYIVIEGISKNSKDKEVDVS